MKTIDPSYRTLYSELAQRALDAQFSAEFSVDGRFITMERNGRRYWYFDLSEPDGNKRRRYVGPADDPDIARRVADFKTLKADARGRRKLVSTLVREAYLPEPDRLGGDIIQALADAGFFRLRGVLVGTMAFQCYSALLGVRLGHSLMQTADADFAQFHSISAAVGDALPPILEILQQVDDSFREVPHAADSRQRTQFVANSGYRVDFLTPNRGSDDYSGRPATMPALGGAAAQPLRFLDFLIHEPVRAVLLHRSGIPVLVPSPARFAVHKLIVAARRRTVGDGTAKDNKDRTQAVTLASALITLRGADDLAEAFVEACDRGPAWREALGQSLRRLDDDSRSLIMAGIEDGITALGIDPAAYRM